MRRVTNIESLWSKILCGDCAKLMKMIPNDSIPLTVTSPPYDGLRTYGGYAFNFDAIATELYRIAEPGGVVVWIVGDETIDGSETGTSFRQARKFKDVGFRLHDTMIYHRETVPRKSTRYEQHFEYMFVLSKGKPKTVNLLREPCKNAGKTYAYKYRRRDGTQVYQGDAVVHATKIRGNVWKYQVGGSKTTSDSYGFRHPATMSEKLVEDHILSWSNRWDIVFDPMCGIGTTLKMAHLNKRLWLGFDINEGYCKLARARMEQAIGNVPKLIRLGPSIIPRDGRFPSSIIPGFFNLT